MQKGGDGYVINVNESIGGMSGHTRYSNNYRPIFEGSLLRGGNQERINTIDSMNRMNHNRTIYEMIQEENRRNNIQQGGGFSPFPAIQSLTNTLAPLGINSLISLILLMGLYDFQVRRPSFKKQMGGYTSSLTEILAPLGKNNLLVVVAILLLHTFTVQYRKKEETPKTRIKKGGFLLEKEISDMFDSLKEGKEYIFQKIHSFIGTNSTQVGGKKSSHHSRDTTYEANGLVVVIQKLLLDQMKETREQNQEIKKKMQEKVTHSWNKLFHMITPISFSAFGTESFLRDVVENKQNYKKYLDPK
jgi:hypothetical protein